MRHLPTYYSYASIWRVAYPIFLTLLVQNLIQVAGTAFLGRVGEVELGASALAGIYYIVVFMLAFGFSTGSQILIGRRNGEGNYHKIGEIVVSGILFLLGIAFILFLFTTNYSEFLLSKLLHSEQVLEAAIEYLDIRIYGIFFASINVMFRAFYVGTTRTKVLSMNALLMAVTTIVLDYLLIFGKGGFPKMGIAGAGLSAVVSEMVSVVFFIVYTFRKIDLLKYGFRGVGIKNLRIITQVLKVSFSLMLQNVLSLGSWFFFFLAIEHMGEQSLAVTNIIRSLYMLVSIPVFALGATANTLVSNSIGAEKHMQVRSLIWKIARLALYICLVFIVFSLLFPRLQLGIYTSSQELIEAALPSLYVVLFALPMVAVSNVFFNSISGTGNTQTALGVEIVVLFLYVFFVWLVAVELKLALHWCWMSELVYNFFLFFFSLLYIYRGKWYTKII